MAGKQTIPVPKARHSISQKKGAATPRNA